MRRTAKLTVRELEQGDIIRDTRTNGHGMFIVLDECGVGRSNKRMILWLGGGSNEYDGRRDCIDRLLVCDELIARCAR